MNIETEMIAVKCEEVETEDKNLHIINGISTYDYKNHEISEKGALGSSLFNEWQNEYISSWCIFDYKTVASKGPFKQKPLSSKDQLALSEIPVGSAFTFTYKPHLKFPKNNDKNIRIKDCIESYSVENIKKFDDPCAVANIYLLIEDFKTCKALKSLDEKFMKEHKLSVNNTLYEVLLRNPSPIAFSIYEICKLLVHKDGRIYINEISEITKWDRKKILKGIDELIDYRYICRIYTKDENGRPECLYFYRPTIRRGKHQED